MKKLILLMTILMVSSPLFAQLQINPQLGISMLRYTDPPSGVDYKAEPGGMIGCDLRFGERFQIQPGLFFMKSKTVVSVDGQSDEGETSHNWIKIKGFVGYNLLDKERFKLRVDGGPAYDILMSAEDKDGNDVKDDLNKGNFSLNAGVGVDFWILTADLGYSFGMTKVSDIEEAGDSKYAGFYFTLGVIFGKGKN